MALNETQVAALYSAVTVRADPKAPEQGSAGSGTPQETVILNRTGGAPCSCHTCRHARGEGGRGRCQLCPLLWGEAVGAATVSLLLSLYGLQVQPLLQLDAAVNSCEMCGAAAQLECSSWTTAALSAAEARAAAGRWSQHVEPVLGSSS